MTDLTEPCLACGALMRWETSHERRDRCGWIRPCCEGVQPQAWEAPAQRGEAAAPVGDARR